jgi:hypothetical protein
VTVTLASSSDPSGELTHCIKQTRARRHIGAFCNASVVGSEFRNDAVFNRDTNV